MQASVTKSNVESPTFEVVASVDQSVQEKFATGDIVIETTHPRAQRLTIPFAVAISPRTDSPARGELPSRGR
ncbi:hypothetical protein FRUB_02678 [Fimbriiglobus ruber]|uniref:Uncharacterized protein n=1 Tax=Fimbriiglobus ruber TaxID=1908690 RepID=A0A225E0R3_9BACT|nr:hypothetical protein FRUB_02678 [Fimbriiglobus ruber]